MSALTDIGAGRPLVFLHGWSVDRSFFAAQRVLAGEGFRILAPDQPGHGASAAPEGGLTIGALAAALDALLETSGLSGAVLVGWSMGATVALERIARRGAARVAGLVIVDMTPKVPNAPDWPFGLADGRTQDETLAAAGRMARNWPRYAPRIAEALFAAGREPDAGLLAHARHVVAGRDAAAMADLWRSLVSADHRATVRALPVPVLAIAGGRSRLYRPEVSAWMAANAPRGRALAIAGAGHMPHAEAPAAFNAAVAEFAASLP